MIVQKNFNKQSNSRQPRHRWTNETLKLAIQLLQFYSITNQTTRLTDRGLIREDACMRKAYYRSQYILWRILMSVFSI
jgi:hypothetical protein